MKTTFRHARSHVSLTAAAAGAVLVACSSAPAESVGGDENSLTQAPNGDIALTFLDTSEQQSQGEWDSCRGKAACATGSGIVGLSEIPGSANRKALCRQLGGLSGNVTAKLTLDGRSDQRRAARNGDWASGFFKMECGENEYVLGVSEDAAQCQGNHDVHAILCGAASGLGDSCRTRRVDGPDDRGTTASGDWDPGAYKGECAVGEYVAGMSVSPSTGRAHSILCCGAGGGGSGRFDALDFMRNTSGKTLHGTDGSIVAFYQVPGQNRFYYVKGDNATYERYAYDGATIRLERDTSWPLADGGGRYNAYDCVDPTSHQYGGMAWAKRDWADGEWLPFTTQVIGFNKSVCQWSQTASNYTASGTKVVHHRNLDVGGDLHTVDAIGIDYGACETHWYARGWGWVKWEYHDTCPNRPGPDVTWNRLGTDTHVPAEPCPNGPLPQVAP